MLTLVWFQGVTIHRFSCFLLQLLPSLFWTLCNEANSVSHCSRFHSMQSSTESLWHLQNLPQHLQSTVQRFWGLILSSMELKPWTLCPCSQCCPGSRRGTAALSRACLSAMGLAANCRDRGTKQHWCIRIPLWINNGSAVRGSPSYYLLQLKNLQRSPQTPCTCSSQVPDC